MGYPIRSLRKTIRNAAYLMRANTRKTVDVPLSSDIRGASLDDYVSVGKRCFLIGSRIGAHSYCGDDCSLPRVDIGPFCSLAGNVMLAAGNHPLHSVSTSPALYRPEGMAGDELVSECTFGEEFFYVDKDEKFYGVIGADCWVATGAILVVRRGGLKLGTGSVVAAGAVVTRDTPPYSIVAGNPARVIKYRFEEETINRLLASRWWEKGDSWIREHERAFISPDALLDGDLHGRIKAQ
ncbi:CatB-related O-acetyltransferase [Adlercreutzia sp. ZJ473]|uniref:CatB-related O-acetyltransferase n=1 Tax=Adlercreutzia sp. ZJ473 TaxID=2722822 RepID=UPI0015545D8C|nr:CatB-related O-acetyltransferase [Adlercreutzia sp. ZJ473]